MYKTKKLDDSNDEKYDVEPEDINVNIDNGNELNNERSINTENENNNSGSPEIETEFTPNNVVSSSKPKTPWFRNPTYRKIGFFAIIGVVICAIIIVLAVCLSKPKKNTPINEENNNGKYVIFSYNISTLYFNSTKEETIKTLLEDLNIDDSKKRRLKEISKTKTINTEYLFTIVSEPINPDDYYTGYVLILSRNETLEGNDKNKYLDDSDNINNDKNFNGVIRIKFKKDGSDIKEEVPEDFNDLYFSEINETIHCIIPKLKDKKVKNENENLYSNNVAGFISINDDTLKDSKYDEDINIFSEKLENEFYKQAVFQKNILMKSSEYKKDNEKNPNIVEVAEGFDDGLTINGLIDSIKINSIQTVKFKKDDGAELAKKYKEKLDALQWSNYNSLSTNKLRILSKEEYEENLKLQNEYEKNSNNLRGLVLQGDKTNSLGSPLSFNYEIFKTNVLGFQFALKANITWVPKYGTILYRLYYQRGKNYVDVKEEKITVEFEHYGNVISSYEQLTMTIIDSLGKLILDKIDGINNELETGVQNFLNKYSTTIEKILDPLSTLYIDYFKVSLDKFRDDIFNYSKDSFQYLYNDMNINSYLDNIYNLLKNGSENNLKNFLSNTETALNTIIVNHKSNLTNLVNQVESFINYSSNSINKLTYYQKVGIDFYYRVKEIFKRIDVMMDSFDDDLANALEHEFLLLQSYVNDDIYLGKIDALIDEVEIIWDIFKNNEILKEIIKYDRAITIENKLELVRKKYEDIKNEFLNQVNKKYEEFKDKTININNNEIQNKKKDLNEKEKILIELIKTKLRYLTNYEIYNEDIKKITNIENEVSKIKLNAYQTYINNKLNEITSDSFLDSTKLNNIKKEIEEEVKNNLLENLKNYNVNKVKENFNNIISKFSELSSNIENIRNNIKNRFSTQNLKPLVSNYYKYVNENGITQYSSLVDEIIKSSLDKYITEPVELLTKIKSMTSDTDNNAKIENVRLQKLVSEKMKNILNDVVAKIRNLIETEINYVRTNINQTYLSNSSDNTIATGTFYTNSNKLIEDLDKKTSTYLDYSFDLTTTFQQKEEEINSKISVVAENLKQKFYYLFCSDNKTLTDCPNAGINKMDEYDKYYFQVSKFRDALNHLTLLQPYINEVINDNNLKDLSADKFLDLYKNPENFDANTIAGLTRQSLNDLINEGINITKSNVNSLKEVIKNSFTSGNNLTEQIFKNFFKNLISIKDLEKKLDLLFINVTKKARNGYTKDLNKIKNSEFFFNVSGNNLEEEYNRTWENYSNELKETKNRLLNNLVLTNKFNQKLIEKFENKIYNDINNYRRDLILYITNKTNCKLLDYEIVLTDIVEEAIIELKNNISTTIKTDLTKNALNDYNLQFNAYFKDLHDKINYHYRNLFDNYYNELTKKSNVTSTNKKEKLTDDIKNGFKEGIDLCKEELKEILNSETLSKSVDDDDKINSLLNDIFSNINLTIPNTNENINHNINDLNTICEKELKRENGIFKDEILEYIKLGFNETILNFMKGTGKSYLDGIFLDDYDVNIEPKLDYIYSQCKEIDEYLYLIIEGLYDVDSYLTNSVKEVYYQLMNYINDGITDVEIKTKLFKKIEQFKLDSAKNIVDYFKNYTLNILKSDSFKNLFSIQVQNLLPEYVPYTLILNFSIIFKELLDSSFLSKIKEKYQTNIIGRRDNLIEELKQLQVKRSLHISQLGQGMSSSDLASAITEYNKLNVSLSKINYKFNFELTNNKKQLANNILLDTTIINYLNKIPKDYNDNFDKIQKLIMNNVKLTLDTNSFKQKIKNLKDTIGNSKPYEEAEKLRDEFFKKFSSLYANLEKVVKDDYSAQALEGTNILPFKNNSRRLYKDDIEIETIQAVINLIDIRFSKLIQNLTKFDDINITNIFKQINSAINVQLLLLDNTMESYLKYSRFYLKNENTLNKYQQNITDIYNEVERILNEFLDSQSEEISVIYNSVDNYRRYYINKTKPEIVEEINKVVKNISGELIGKYLEEKKNLEIPINETNEKKTDLKNLGDVNAILGSTRLNYQINIDTTTLDCGYKFVPDKNNSKVLLDVFASGNSNLTITYGNDYYETSIAGSLGRGIIGMNITSNFSNERVYIDYYTKYKNYTYTQTLKEYTILDSWGVCEDVVDCFVGKNEDYCPYIVRVEDEEKTIVKNETIDLDYYKNSSYYIFTGYYENSLCTFANYFYTAEAENYEYNTSMRTTI